MKLSTSIVIGCAAQITAESPEELVKNDPSVKFIADHETGGALTILSHDQQSQTPSFVTTYEETQRGTFHY